MPFTYILKCSDNTLYTGCAKDIYKRFIQHQNGKAAKYTRGRRPLYLVYVEYFSTMSKALIREKKIQKLNKDQKKILIIKK